MSAADQDTPATGSPKAPGAPKTADELADRPEDGHGGAAAAEPDDEGDEFDDESAEPGGRPAGGLTPRQARRLRVAAASVLLVALAVVLVVRLASRTSVLVVGVYGLAMILCGIVIELSRNGRTRLGTWLLAGGLLAALALDWLVLP
ncbi:hypothetical protein [Streptomyces sp. NPDC088915]|uniref:hypothetical protein n=1 Tax=Streptomyces sp. NPDC088915 TaxID=3365912 RepID=UPI00382A26CA